METVQLHRFSESAIRRLNSRSVARYCLPRQSPILTWGARTPSVAPAHSSSPPPLSSVCGQARVFVSENVSVNVRVCPHYAGAQGCGSGFDAFPSSLQGSVSVNESESDASGGDSCLCERVSVSASEYETCASVFGEAMQSAISSDAWEESESFRDPSLSCCSRLLYRHLPLVYPSARSGRPSRRRKRTAAVCV